MNDIRTSAILATLTIREGGLRKQDKSMRDELIATHKLTENAVSVSKRLFPQEPKELKAIHSHVERMRRRHSDLTLPWYDDARILSMPQFPIYSREMQDLEDEFWILVSAWEAVVAYEIQVAESLLNGKFDPTNYSTNVREHYAIVRRTRPIPDAQDYRIPDSTPDVDVDVLRQQVAADYAEGMKAAIEDLYMGLADDVYELSKKIRTDNTGLRQKSISKLEARIDQADRLNVTNIPELTAIVGRIRQVLSGLRAKDVNTDATLKDSLVKILDSEMGELVERASKI